MGTPGLAGCGQSFVCGRVAHQLPGWLPAASQIEEKLWLFHGLLSRWVVGAPGSTGQELDLHRMLVFPTLLPRAAQGTGNKGEAENRTGYSPPVLCRELAGGLR